MGWELYSYPDEQYLGDVTDYQYCKGDPTKFDVATFKDRNADPIDGLRTDIIEFTAPAMMLPGDYLLVDEDTGQRQRIVVRSGYQPGDRVIAYPGPKAGQ